jgi:Abnormal spindle-like microcephaly-assoc'd, ASPM-SPD-2-Hydin/Immunoglobulin I-set domain
MKAKRPAGTNFLFFAALFSFFLFFSGLHAKGQSQSTCVQSGTGVWQNHAFTSQSSQFVVTYSATPSHAAMNGVVGFSVNAATSLTNLPVIVRFSNTGVIDVRNGGSFSAATSYPYTAGTQYAFQLAINPATKRYSVFVTAPSGTQVELASNYAFRSDQSGVSSLNSWATYSKGGTETVCNMTIASAGSSVTAPTISAQPASNSVTAGQTATFSVTASGTAPLGYQWTKNGAAISGATAASYTTPATTSTDNGSQFVVTVSNSAGSVTSSAAILTVNAPAVAPTITTQPKSQTITAGQTTTFSVTASGTAPMGYQWAKNGAAISGATGASYTTPATTSTDNGSQFVVTVSNSAGSAASAAATLTVSSTPGTLSLSSSSLSFGSVTVGSSKALSTTLTNTGGSSVTVSNVSISGAGFNPGGISNGQIITAGEAVTVSVTFAPAATGGVTGGLAITSNASNSPTQISLSGTGAAASYSTTLSWTASTSSVTGYNVYRGTTSGGPYTKLTASVDSNDSYADNSVQAGLTYYYVVTSVNSSGAESVYSNQVSATIP